MENQQIREGEKKRYLRRYKNNRSCIVRLKDKLNTLELRYLSPGSPNMSGMPRGGMPVAPSDLIAEKDELKERIARLEAKGRKLKREILTEIDSLEDPRYCDVLEAYFIDCLTIEEIAENEGYTDRHVYRLYSEAITALVYNDICATGIGQ